MGCTLRVSQPLSTTSNDKPTRTWALNDACHVEHVVFAGDDANPLWGVGLELGELLHESAHDHGRDGL